MSNNLNDVQQIKNVYNIEKQMIKLVLLNIRSLSTKALFVNDMITDHKLDVLCLTETWLKPDCSKVRRKEGSGQGWLVKTQVFLFKADKLTQVRTLRHPETSTLSFVSAITLCIRSDCFSLTARAPESSLRLSL